MDGQTNEYMRWKKHAATRIITRIQLGEKIKDDIYTYCYADFKPLLLLLTVRIIYLEQKKCEPDSVNRAICKWQVRLSARRGGGGREFSVCNLKAA